MSSPPFTVPGQLHLEYSTSTAQHAKNNQGGAGYYSPSKASPSHHAKTGIFQLPSSLQHFYVLPVLLLEFLALALTRAVLPSMLLQEYGSRTYLVLGFADCIRGLLAFLACPLFGRLSDVFGRKSCLFVTVLGTCAPVCSLALFSWKSPVDQALVFSDETTSSMDGDDDGVGHHIFFLPPMAIPVFVVLLSLSGMFSSTFTLVFAYISDTVSDREERVSAYGLALATFGLSFTIGPMAGGYLAKTNTHFVFISSLVLAILDLLYIHFILPESKQDLQQRSDTSDVEDDNASTSVSSILFLRRQLDIDWSPLDSLRLILHDPFLRKVGQVAFFYYTGLWAVISTLSLYAVQQFHLSPERLGELMSALGLCTMVAEAVLVRIMVPLMGEKHATRLGLLSFAAQCLILGGAQKPWHLFVCVAFSLLGNLVYPSLSSLVSSTVEPKRVGEALGAINGVKALTEGLGPLLFGALMTVSEDSDFPGWPYWIAALLVLVAYDVSSKLPEDHQSITATQEYIHELEFKRRNSPKSSGRANDDDEDDQQERGCLKRPTPVRDEDEEVYQHLLSDIETSDDDDMVLIEKTKPRSPMTGPFQESPAGENLDLSFFTPPQGPTPSSIDETFRFATPAKRQPK
eukprot:Nitzschia sp. Nitz4//scaffold50_size126154//15349//17238//NITZ4_003670-RA/size126154-processed-gene-0.50-mRNA-1//-1//CDS//3329553653//7198//frame0